MQKNYNEILYENQTIELKTITLRKFRGSDASDVLEYASDAQTMQHLIWTGANSLEEVKKTIHNNYLSRLGVFAITLNESGKCIGDIEIRLNEAHERAVFAYVLNRDYWGRGIMSEALNAILSLCFDKLELRRVEGGHFTGNEASGRVMEKCGMKKEGLAREVYKAHGVFRDEVRYAILKSEWDKMSLKTGGLN